MTRTTAVVAMNFLQRYWYTIRSSFWFVPGLIVLGMLALALGAIDIDGRIGRDALADWPRLFGAQAQGSRTLLAAVATSMITVAGTVFSITLVALSLASSQYSSRVLRNFMSDRSNQTVLGVFVGIFAYCLVVLRTVRDVDVSDPFVPAIAVLLGLVLGFVGIAFLVFFIHHISVSIQASQIVAAAAHETLHTIDQVFPPTAPDCDPDRQEEPVPGPNDVWQIVDAHRNGYLQQIETRSLLRFASRYQALVRLERAIGEYVVEGTPLIAVRRSTPLDLRTVRWLRSCCGIGRQRTLEQDVGFGVRQLVDVALKALSPGVNDTTTAIMCVDHLTSILHRVARRRLRYGHCTDAGLRRVQVPHPRFHQLLRTAYEQIRQHSRGNVAVLERLLWSAASLANEIELRDRLTALHEHVTLVAEAGQRDIVDPTDRQLFAVNAGGLLRLLDQRLAEIR